MWSVEGDDMGVEEDVYGGDVVDVDVDGDVNVHGERRKMLFCYSDLLLCYNTHSKLQFGVIVICFAPCEVISLGK